MTHEPADTIRPRPRHMAEKTAEGIHGSITAALAELNNWQNNHPNVADYRVEEAAANLRRAQRLLGYLRDDTDPEGDAARAQLRQRDTEREERAAREMGGAVWTDLHTYARVVDTPPTALFHYSSRDVTLTRNEHGTVFATIVEGPGTGRAWDGSTAQEAITAMVAALYGIPCAHEYGTGRDSCPGCDYTQEQFEQRHAGNLRHMGATSFA